jgi:hypothetical protein
MLLQPNLMLLNSFQHPDTHTLMAPLFAVFGLYGITGPLSAAFLLNSLQLRDAIYGYYGIGPCLHSSFAKY